MWINLDFYPLEVRREFRKPFRAAKHQICLLAAGGVAASLTPLLPSTSGSEMLNKCLLRCCPTSIPCTSAKLQMQVRARVGGRCAAPLITAASWSFLGQHRLLFFLPVLQLTFKILLREQNRRKGSSGRAVSKSLVSKIAA